MELIEQVLGLNRPGAELGVGQMAARAVIVFFAGILFLRLGTRRELGRNAGFDILMMVILGSVLSRGVNGQSPFFPTLGVSFLLVMLHRATAWLASRVHWVSRAIKGAPHVLVRNGQIDEAVLRRSLMSHEDLEESLRTNGNVPDARDVAEARLERNGEVSVVKKK